MIHHSLTVHTHWNLRWALYFDTGNEISRSRSHRTWLLWHNARISGVAGGVYTLSFNFFGHEGRHRNLRMLSSQLLITFRNATEIFGCIPGRVVGSKTLFTLWIGTEISGVLRNSRFRHGEPFDKFPSVWTVSVESWWACDLAVNSCCCPSIFPQIFTCHTMLDAAASR